MAEAGKPQQTGAPARRVVVALGANLGEREATLRMALDRIAQEIGPLLARSGWMETEAVIHPDDPADWHPAFLNGAALFASALEPEAILDRLHAVERELGRDRERDGKPWQPRLIDLDLVAIEDLVVENDRLVLPHPRMHERAFVLQPFVEVWPDWPHPKLGRTAAELAARLDEGA